MLKEFVKILKEIVCVIVTCLKTGLQKGETVMSRRGRGSSPKIKKCRVCGKLYRLYDPSGHKCRGKR